MKGTSQMTNKTNIGPAVIIAIGVIGTLASVVSMPDTLNPLRWILLVIFILLSMAGIAAALNNLIPLKSAWSLLRNCRRLGITEVQMDGKSGEELPYRLRHARTIKIMVISGIVLVRQFKDELVEALRNRAHVMVLLANPTSDFIKDVEEAEAHSRSGQIGPELRQVEQLLVEYLTEASGREADGFHGRIDVAYFRTQYRTSLIICDDNWGKLTLVLAPKRAVQMPSLEMKACDGSLLADCIQHFDKIWELSRESGLVRVVNPVATTGQMRPAPLGQNDRAEEALSKATAFLAERENRWYLDFANHFYADVNQAVIALLKANSFEQFAIAAGAKIEVETSLIVVKNRLEKEGFTTRNETFCGVSPTGQEMVSKPQSIYGIHRSGAVLMCPTARRMFDQVHQELQRRSKA